MSEKPIFWVGSSLENINMTQRRTRKSAIQSTGNVFVDIGFCPGEAEHLRLRAQLMMAIRRVIEQRQLTQVHAAQLLGVTQPRISDLMRGKIDLFSIDTLVGMLAAAGMHVDMTIEAAA
jgi:predicted XRE-type DNA-binding protein